MKKLTFLLVFISIFGYAQAPILPSIQERFPQEFLYLMNPNALTPQVDEFLDMNQNVNNVQSQLFQSEMLFQDGNYDLRLDSQNYIIFGSTGLNSKYEYTYYANGNQTLFIYYNWNTDSQSFVPSFKDEYTYDANGNRTLYIRYNWDTDSQSFVPYYKSEYTSDANGNLPLRIGYFWNTDSQSFVPSSKTEYTYDANGNIPLEIGYNWNTNSQSFLLTSKYEFTFEANGNLHLFIGYNWNTDSQSFVPSYKYEYTYDANGNRTLYIRYNWDTDSQSLVPSGGKYEYTYDANNFKTNETSYIWYAALGVYKPNFKMDISIQSETDTNIVREGITYEYDTNFNTWNELEGEEFKSYWYYTKVSTLSADKIETLTFAIYPNPTSNTLFISGNETPIAVDIYNVLGKEVLSIKNTNNINVEALPSGVYVIRISDGVGQTNKKFIKN